MRVAIEGCCHGELDRIYASIRNLERDNLKIDLLIVCGDFQSIRNVADLEVLACPDKFRTLGTFYQYYSGQKKAPYPTIFVGGNHEASNYLWELYHGGWVCPNIYFMGFGGVINFGGLRIGGLSGIFKPHHYEYGHYEVQPYNDQDSRSVYHVRKYNVQRMALIQQPLDVFISHDWPKGIESHGNTKKLLDMKPFLRNEVHTNTLGSPPNEYLLKKLKPKYWFSAHLHVKFAALYEHVQGNCETSRLGAPHAFHELGSIAVVEGNPEEIDIHSDHEEMMEETYRHVDEKSADNSGGLIRKSDGLDSADQVDSVPANANSAVDDPNQSCKESLFDQMDVTSDANAAAASSHGNEQAARHPKYTRFLSLDKCLPGRDFLQIVNIPEVECSGEFFYDEEWLAIMRATNDYFSLAREQKLMPSESELRKRLMEELDWIKENVPRSSLRVPDNFVTTAAGHVPGHRPRLSDLLRPHLNPQTVDLCKLIGITNYVNANGVVLPSRSAKDLTPTHGLDKNPESLEQKQSMFSEKETTNEDKNESGQQIETQSPPLPEGFAPENVVNGNDQDMFKGSERSPSASVDNQE
ncbi:lariat debranching enzyme, C-terminal domain-containing protein [Cladochytrium replicatum]|nr:lariat debranching enzyme, C-terminal domain-containing protein [Cladochytrium replicatum]